MNWLADPVELALIRLQGGLVWLTGGIWAWTTAREEKDRTDQIIDLGRGTPTAASTATRNRGIDGDKAATRLKTAWLIIGVWMAATLVGSVVWQTRTGHPVGGQVAIHVLCTLAMILLIAWDATKPIVDITLCFMTLTGNVAFAAWSYPPSVIATIGGPVLVGVAVAWVHGPATPEEAPTAQPATKRRAVGGVDAPSIVRGLREAVPSIEAIYKQVEDARAKGGRRPEPIQGVDLVKDTKGRVVAGPIVLPGRATAADLIKETPRFAKNVGAHPDAVFVDVVDGNPGVVSITILPKPLSLMPLPSWPHSDGAPIDVFDGIVVGFDGRLDQVRMRVHDESALIAGQSGSGKSNIMRVTSTAWGMDPTTAAAVFNFSGNREFEHLRPCSPQWYHSGSGDTEVRAFRDFLKWAVEVEHPRRIALINDRLDLAPSGSITKQAIEQIPGLFLLRVFVDELHVACNHGRYGDEIRTLLERYVRECRKSGLTGEFATQTVEADSVPTGLVNNMSNKIVGRMQSANASAVALGHHWDGPKPSTFETRGTAALRGNVDSFVGIDGEPRRLGRFPKLDITEAKALVDGVARGDMPPVVVDDAAGVVGSVLVEVLTGWPAAEVFHRSAVVAQRVAAARGVTELSTAALAAEIAAAGGPEPARGVDPETGTRRRGYTRAAVAAAAGTDPEEPSTARPRPVHGTPTGHPEDSHGTAAGTGETPHRDRETGEVDGLDTWQGPPPRNGPSRATHDDTTAEPSEASKVSTNGARP